MARDIAGSFAAGASIRERRRLAQQKKIADARANLEASRTGSIESVDEFIGLAKELANAGVDREDPKFKEVMEKGVRGSAMGHANVLRELQETARAAGNQEAFDAIEDPNAFVETQMLRAMGAVDAAFAGRPRILKPEELPEQLQDAVVQDVGGKLPVLQQRKTMLVEAGIPAAVAGLVAAGGVATIVDPVDDNVDIINKGTGETIFTTRRPPGEPSAVPPVVPPGVDAAAATGIPGMFTNLVNIVSDAVNLGTPFEEAQQATSALNLIQTTTVLELQAPIAGRPAKDIREDIKKITVKPNSFFSGPQRSLSTFKQMQRFIDTNIAERQNALDTESMSPEDRAKLEGNIRTLGTMRESYDDLIGSIETKSGDVMGRARAASDAAFKAQDLERMRAINAALESNDFEALEKLLDKDDGSD
jgi:hypothetical protein